MYKSRLLKCKSDHLVIRVEIDAILFSLRFTFQNFDLHLTWLQFYGCCYIQKKREFLNNIRVATFGIS